MSAGNHRRHASRAAALLLVGAALNVVDEGCSTPPPTTTTAAVKGTGLAQPPSSLYDDIGLAESGAPFRALFGLPLQDRAGLNATLAALYDPSSPNFRKYLAVSDWMTAYGPGDATVATAQGWLTSQGFAVPRTSASKMLIEFTGTIAQFQAAFQTHVHLFVRQGTSRTETLNLEYAPDSVLTLPPELQTTLGVLTIDPAADTTMLGAEGTTVLGPPADETMGLMPSQIASIYGYDALAMQGGDGSNVTMGLIVADSFKLTDARAFWTNWQITRADPIVKNVMEPPGTRVVETALDVEWMGGLAPKAALIVYQAPDIRDTSMLYSFGEAVAAGEVSVLSNSFGHREGSVSKAVANMYDDIAQMGATLGMTIVAATGDSNGVDVPSVCPHVTAVGGTSLAISGSTVGETAWSMTGAGDSAYFPIPSWQSVAMGATGRGVADVALNAETKYWVVNLGAWDRRGGTSFSSPVFGAMIADVNSARIGKGQPTVGYLNSILYANADVQATFRDIVLGSSGTQSAEAGWDFASGWGSPNALGLFMTLP